LVWDVLTDFAAYHEWNPYVKIEGTARVGTKLTVHIGAGGGRDMAFKPTLLAATPDVELFWLGRLGFGGMTFSSPKYQDRVPHVVEIGGRPAWVAEGIPIGFAGRGGVLDRESQKHPFNESSLVWGIDRVHEGAYNPEVRLQVMDEYGIHAQVLYPQAIGLGGQNLSKLVDDAELQVSSPGQQQCF
jgi:hypothetical protein